MINQIKLDKDAPKVDFKSVHEDSQDSHEKWQQFVQNTSGVELEPKAHAPNQEIKKQEKPTNMLFD